MGEGLGCVLLAVQADLVLVVAAECAAGGRGHLLLHNCLARGRGREPVRRGRVQLLLAAAGRLLLVVLKLHLVLLLLLVVLLLQVSG